MIKQAANNASRILPSKEALEIGGRLARQYWTTASLTLMSGIMLAMAYQISITPPANTEGLTDIAGSAIASVADIKQSQQSLAQANPIRVILPSPYGHLTTESRSTIHVDQEN